MKGSTELARHQLSEPVFWLAFPAVVGRLAIRICVGIGSIVLFAIDALGHVVRPPFHLRELWQAILNIGFYSLPIVGLTALFAGAALALQIQAGSARLSSETAVPVIVAIGMVRELGPVLCGLIVAGRVASSIGAEIATMKVTDQIDALRTLSTHPTKFLVVPRIIAATVVMPVLAGVGDIIGILGGFLVSTGRLGYNPDLYVDFTVRFLETSDVVSGLVKAAVFGFIISVIGCYFGANSGQGAKGVGRATTNSVAAASVLIIAANYAMTELFFRS
ncbi:MAG: ABC transporter permease [Rhodobacteraceae bacterium]|nr:ABC transporter permease [Paracoccaceae bacterium]